MAEIGLTPFSINSISESIKFGSLESLSQAFMSYTISILYVCVEVSISIINK